MIDEKVDQEVNPDDPAIEEALMSDDLRDKLIIDNLGEDSQDEQGQEENESKKGGDIMSEEKGKDQEVLKNYSINLNKDDNIRDHKTIKEIYNDLENNTVNEATLTITVIEKYTININASECYEKGISLEQFAKNISSKIYVEFIKRQGITQNENKANENENETNSKFNILDPLMQRLGITEVIESETTSNDGENSQLSSNVKLKYKGMDLGLDIEEYRKANNEDKQKMLESAIGEIDKKINEKENNEKNYMTIAQLVDMSVDYYKKLEGKGFNTFILNGVEININEWAQKLTKDGIQPDPNKLKEEILKYSIEIIQKTHGKDPEEKKMVNEEERKKREGERNNKEGEKDDEHKAPEPKPEAESPKPEEDSPKPEAESPKPEAESPKPEEESPKPDAENNHETEGDKARKPKGVKMKDAYQLISRYDDEKKEAYEEINGIIKEAEKEKDQNRSPREAVVRKSKELVRALFSGVESPLEERRAKRADFKKIYPDLVRYNEAMKILISNRKLFESDKEKTSAVAIDKKINELRRGLTRVVTDADKKSIEEIIEKLEKCKEACELINGIENIDDVLKYRKLIEEITLLDKIAGKKSVFPEHIDVDRKASSQVNPDKNFNRYKDRSERIKELGEAKKQLDKAKKDKDKAKKDNKEQKESGTYEDMDDAKEKLAMAKEKLREARKLRRQLRRAVLMDRLNLVHYNSIQVVNEQIGRSAYKYIAEKREGRNGLDYDYQSIAKAIENLGMSYTYISTDKERAAWMGEINEAERELEKARKEAERGKDSEARDEI